MRYYKTENMKRRAIHAAIMFGIGCIGYALLVLVFALVFDGRGIDRNVSLIYPAELLPIISILLLSLVVAFGD